MTSYIIAFIKLPKLAGELVSLLPAFGLVSIVGSRFVSKAQKNTSTHLSHAASLSAEALNKLAGGTGVWIAAEIVEYLSESLGAGEEARYAESAGSGVCARYAVLRWILGQCVGVLQRV